MDEAERGVSHDLKQRQPGSQEYKEKALVGHPPPTVLKLYPKFLKNSVRRLIFHRYAISTLFDTESEHIAQLNSPEVLRKQCWCFDLVPKAPPKRLPTYSQSHRHASRNDEVSWPE